MGVLKTAIAQEMDAKVKWTNFVEELIKDVATKTVGYAAGQIANIYIREAWWDRLLEMVRNSPSLDALERYEPYLKKDHADELAILYAEAVLKYVREIAGRQHYKTAARYLRRIKKLGIPAKGQRDCGNTSCRVSTAASLTGRAGFGVTWQLLKFGT